MKRVLIRWIVRPAVVLAVLFGGLLAYRADRQAQTAKLLAITTKNGIREGMFISIGGIVQWVTIRGEDRNNPVILLVHGGPGLTTSPVAVWFRAWERHFTVVHWDQRGAGKTYGRYQAETPEMNVTRIIEDGCEVAEFLRDHLHKDKVILVGHSWGAALGVIMVQRRPDLFSAYVGTGQTVDTSMTEAGNYDRLLQAARVTGDQESITTLKQVGRPPYDSPDEALAVRHVAGSYEADSERNYIWRAIGTSVFSPDMSWRDLDDASKGSRFSTRVFLSGPGKYEARSFGLTFQVPMFFFQGEADNVTPTPLVERYAADISSPHTETVLIRGGGHNVMLAMPDVFLDELLARVRPTAVASSGP